MIGTFTSSLIRVFLDGSLFLLGGFLLAGLLAEFVRSERITRHLGGGGLRPVFLATVLGAPLPLCSCSVVPAARELRRKGASTGAVVAFLISTPETGIDSILLTYGYLGPAMMIARPVAAVLTALVAGVLTLLTGQKRADSEPLAAAEDEQPRTEHETPEVAPQEMSLTGRLDRALRHGFVEIFDELAPWLILAFVLSALLDSCLGPDSLTRLLPYPILGMLAAALVGIPTYVCASGSTPVAATLIAKGLSPGAGLVYMLTGPATNLTTLAVVARLFGRRILALYLGSVFSVAILAGLAFDALISGGAAKLMEPGAGRPSNVFMWLEIFAALSFIGLLVPSVRRGSFRHAWRETRAGLRETRVLLGFLRPRIPWRMIARTAGVALLALWVSTAFFIVQPGERGIVVAFGRPVGEPREPGGHVVPPWPIGVLRRVPVGRVHVMEVGYRTGRAAPDLYPLVGNRVLSESRYVTGDENIVDATASVLWRVVDPKRFVFRSSDVERSLRGIARAALTSEFAGTPLDALYASARAGVELAVLARLRTAGLEKALGVEVMAVQLLYVHAPDEVHAAFRDVASAGEDRTTRRNRALVEQESTVRLAAGEAARQVLTADAQRLLATSKAASDAHVFEKLATSSRQFGGLVAQRLYWERMERALAAAPKLILPDPRRFSGVEVWITSSGRTGVVPAPSSTKPPAAPSE
jgi:uncharacterized membrane protein YraQ (UPF0718 family)/regulator of protease activity HflC (stomatin/prohibitin superfamily)